MPTDFHFLQPLWLLALLPLAAMLWLIARRGLGETPWHKLVDPQLRPLLLEGQAGQRSKLPIRLLSIGWLLAVLALANPTWEQQPQSLLQTGTSRVIVLDLSRSMLVPDVKPSRLVRARFKVEDILAHNLEGQTGLVVFAGDAFTVTPLTRDADTIRAQLKALDPSIMPSQGSRADLGLLKSLELLQQGGVKSGQVILIADGVEGDQAAAAAARLHASGYEVSVLGVGTTDGAPLPDGRGGTLRDQTGKPVLPRLEHAALASVAESGGGRYTGLRGDQGDLNYLLQTDTPDGDSVQSDDLQAQKWKEQGPWLAVLLLPLAALAFRRGWILGVLLCTGTLLPPEPAMALGWDQLWQRADQRAAQALHSGDYEQAARLAEDPARRGSALYKQGDFENALSDFSALADVDADAAYNRGNALARLNRYQEAISAYEQALELRPGMQDALANKAAVEALLDQQRQASSDQQDNEEQSSPQDQASVGQDDPAEQEDQQQSSQQQPSSSAQDDPDQQNDSEQADAGQGDAAQQDQDEPTDPGSGGTPENVAQSEQGEAPEPQTGEQEETESAQDEAENQFAEANRQLDKGRDDSQAEQERNAPQTPSEDKQAHTGPQLSEPSVPTGQQDPPLESQAEADALNNEEQMAAQQWLRRIPDDPGGLLRRKFLYQYRQRSGPADNAGRQAW